MSKRLKKYIKYPEIINISLITNTIAIYQKNDTGT